MSERKAINKYYPPDYDPSKVPKAKKNKDIAIKVRLSAPFSMRCLKCDEYISSSRKFNARKEDTKEKYLGIKIFRFYLRCPICNNEISFKTHPQSSGFVLETGAKRNFEPKNKVVVPVQETQDEILERLLKEDQENKKFQESREQRKKNPFWKENNLKKGAGDLTENLGEKLQEQQRQYEINEQLEYLQAKQSKLLEKEAKLKSTPSEVPKETEPKQISEDKLVSEAFTTFTQEEKGRAREEGNQTDRLFLPC
ncbi:DUF572-domain-containing protein [Yamadazyma tenuis ATCC 10573]|uniref:Splicing factor YJU2 n=1 Tax=Candida tenuis (strain ATCC 10573 / BCRC 21748 / CBS 615 / JCM 9827 / NBRC 10315 / NRRL Y-1498 / VKM Y-70) TaxID=590646 RepID=G3AVZ8_CANTC|nr:DUF572-domain-containing protein [Yamadazyma tenuis ATCC 10573]EGV66417.1 DUF572-domain-containing protein [Yamadazyma tenuis ATCC 10573]